MSQMEPNQKTKPCTSCDGTGEILWRPNYYNYVPSGKIDCSKCKGTGKELLEE